MSETGVLPVKDSPVKPTACCPSCQAKQQARQAARAQEHDHAGHGHAHEQEEGFSWTWRIIVPGLLFVGGLLGGGWLTATVGAWSFYLVMAMAYLLCGLPVLRDAGEALLRRDFFNEFTLMSLATLVAICLGEWSEAVGVMLFYSLGEAAQEKAAGSSRRSIQALLASKPEIANLMENGQVRQVEPEAVPVGSTILVKPGEKVPLDGLVLSGAASVDMSSLTGESVPVSVGKDSQVFSGSISLDGDLVVQTTAQYSDSMVGKILAMVENAVGMKSKTERFITVFARYYTPVVTGAAALVAIVPPLLFGQEWSEWVYRALVLLVVSCPCALFLSVPLAFFAGIGTASRHGMLVKGGQVFDALVRAKSIVFDKTGTLTKGTLVLTNAQPVANVSREELIHKAALAESRSSHPVAKAVVDASGDSSVFHQNVTTKNVAGMGVVAEAPEGEILVGNAALLEDRGIAFEPAISDELVAYVAFGGNYLGWLSFADQIKPDSIAAVQELRSMGIDKTYMLTGDRPEAAKHIAGQIGLDGFKAGLLPDQKVSAFRELSPAGDAVFVGDGVNDAPVLASAGVGVAMGALGSAAAVEAADAVILDDSPARLPTLFRIARKTHRIAKENIFFALAIKSLIMLLGVAGLSGLWEAVFADVGVALLAVLNSMRMTRM